MFVVYDLFSISCFTVITAYILPTYCTVCLFILKHYISLIHRISTCTIQASTCMYMLTQTFQRAHARRGLNGRLGAVTVRYQTVVTQLFE